MPDDFELPFPQYRCPTCAIDLPLTEARIVVTCAEHHAEQPVDFTVREAEAPDRGAIELICERAIGETEVDIFGKTHDVMDGSNFVAEADGELAGLLSTAVIGGELAIVMLSVYPRYQGRNVGTALLDAADTYAAGRGLSAVRAAVTNDDIPLLSFYQRHGFAIYDVAVGEVADRLGSAVPGFSAIPMRDEIRLRRPVCER
jgi:ribosomal protein S18 acetylase RimI-like enzyme